MLPITPPDQYGSPYSSPSAFAGWNVLVKGEKLNDMPNEEYWLD